MWHEAAAQRLVLFPRTSPGARKISKQAPVRARNSKIMYKMRRICNLFCGAIIATAVPKTHTQLFYARPAPPPRSLGRNASLAKLLCDTVRLSGAQADLWLLGVWTRQATQLGCLGPSSGEELP